MFIHEIFHKGKKLIPSFQLAPQPGEIIGIQTDMQRKQCLLTAFAAQQDSYVLSMADGEYERHTVKELLQFLTAITGSSVQTDHLLEKFGLTEIQRIKIKNLPVSKQTFLKQLRICFAPQSVIILEEPYFYLEEADRKIFSRLLDELCRAKQLIILAANLADALISCHQIYRLDEEGLKQLDIADSEELKKEAEEIQPIKLEKISTKKNDKTILFDPPEIDYIESVEGTIYVHVGGENYACNFTLTELDKKLQSYGFFRCHRSYIVNLQKVREIITWTKNSYSLRLNTGKDSVVPLSRTKLQDLRDLLGI